MNSNSACSQLTQICDSPLYEPILKPESLRTTIGANNPKYSKIITFFSFKNITAVKSFRITLYECGARYKSVPRGP